jgi:Ca-activated chloride channel homolog
MYVTFDQPIYLWLLFCVPLIIISHFYFLKRSKSKAMKFANVETIRRIYGDRLITKNIVHLILRVATLFCLIIAITGTNLWYMGKSSDVNYVVAIDSSASMTSQDIKPSRFLAAKENINDFIRNLDAKSKIGLVTFAGVTEVLQKPTDSRLDFKLAMGQADVSSTGGTDISGAIITSTNLLLQDSEKGRALIMISDGVNTLGSFVTDPIIESVDYAKQNQVIIYTVGIGTNQGPIGFLPEYYNISATYNEDTLAYIANETGGKYFHVSSADEFSQVLTFLGDNSSEKYININLSFGALLIAILFLFVEWGIANTLYKRIL